MPGSIATTKISVAPAWGKITFYYKHGLSGLTDSSSATENPIANILDRMENNYWQAKPGVLSTVDINFDAGAGQTYTADYIAFNGHNFRLTEMEIDLEYSDALDLSDPLNSGTTAYTYPTAYPPADKLPIIAEFTSAAARYWRLRLEPIATYEMPKITNAWWGEKTEMDWATADFDPNESEYDEIVNISQTGRVLGILKRQRKRSFKFQIDDADAALYAKANALFEAVEFEPFFVNWNYTENPNSGYYMRDNRGLFAAPYRIASGDNHRNLNFDLIGRQSPWQ